MKIAVLGAHGQLGRDLCPRLPGDVVPLTRAQIDLAAPAGIAAVLADLRPDLFVNCAAYNLVDKAEFEPQVALDVNAWGVKALAEACQAVGCKLVHFSTDYVFGGDSPTAKPNTPLAETDVPAPLGVYGVSKLVSEYMALTPNPKNLVIRTCGLYGVWGTGGKGGNFVETMLRLAGEGKPLRVVNDQHCTPSYTVDVADATVGLIRAGASGIFHVTNAGATTWHDLAAEAFRLAGVKADLTPIP
ncbi:MAG TPA: dTDP-4-dehydrorhamnose reductase, partial [Gemmataceae bacterium]|nr:dTDP-4-dehydrorhamnose reductase [Gemmataceae bacterium]